MGLIRLDTLLSPGLLSVYRQAVLGVGDLGEKASWFLPCPTVPSFSQPLLALGAWARALDICSTEM